MKQTVERHLVRAIAFEPKNNEGAMECTCGWWGGTGAFPTHRREAGAAPNKGYSVQNELSYDRATYGVTTPATSDAASYEG